MAELDELRVRLEGALEIVEAATASLVVATEALEEGVVSELAEAMITSDSAETRDAVKSIERLAEQAPALTLVLKRFHDARGALLARALVRGQQLGLHSMSAESVIDVLARYPVLFEGLALQRLPFVAVGALMAALTAFAVAFHPGFLVLPLGLLLACAALVWRSPRLVVTRGHVRMGAAVVAVRDIESVLVASAMGPDRSIVRFRLRGGSTFDAEMPALPKRFVRALEQVTTVEHST